jgi:hypothetical protein
MRNVTVLLVLLVAQEGFATRHGIASAVPSL